MWSCQQNIASMSDIHRASAENPAERGVVGPAVGLQIEVVRQDVLDDVRRSQTGLGQAR